MSQIKTRKRVRDLGEVYTNRREVDAMLDLVGESTYQIETRMLEPACGNGNFLVAILERKLVAVDREPLDDIEYNIIKALSNIHGIDIDKSNVEESIERMIDIAVKYYKDKFSIAPGDDLIKSIRYVLSRNIILGDSLNGQEDIVFSDFKISKNKIIESRFPYLELLKPCEDQQPQKILSERVFSRIHLNGDVNEF